MHILDFEKPVYELQTKIEEIKELNKNDSDNKTSENLINAMEQELESLKTRIYSRMSPWEKTLVARHPERVNTEYFFNSCCSDFVSLHGDRHCSDDSSVLCGFAKLEGISFAVLGHLKGKNIEENVARNFGMPHPEGYRKALRIMKLAEKFSLPILTLIDTPGAYPGLEAEERNQSEAIAVNLQEMSDLRVPVISIIMGEGGSGGAIALGVANTVLMLEHAVYSVISPEGCASILWSDAKKAKDAANALKYTAQNLKKLEIIDDIIPEPFGGAHHDPEQTGKNMLQAVISCYEKLKNMSPDELVEHRYNKFRKIGFYNE